MLRSLFVDFNSYFASVEQQLNPALRGRPVGVVPVMAETSCCIAASYEAKKFGIKTGTGIREARLLCPDIVFIVAEHAKYVEIHHEAVAAVDRIVPVRQVLSIDEMECELPTRWRSSAKATEIALSVKREIQTTVGEVLRTSIGIAPNTLLAKLASDMQKPDGLTVIERADIPAKFEHLPLSAINGVGKRMLERLNRSGIHTMRELYAAPRDLLRTAWGGIAGEEMHDKLHGLWTAPRETVARSLGHSHMLPPAMRNPTDALAVLHRLTQKAAMRLRKQGHYATAMSVSVRCGDAYRGDPGGHRDTRFGETQDTAFFIHALDALWRTGLHELQQPKAVGMVLHGLVPANQHTMDLFEQPVVESAKTPPRDRTKLLSALDAVNRKQGKNALYFATSHTARDHAPMRIAFNRIPDVETER
jgi:DNA polymerase IV